MPPWPSRGAGRSMDAGAAQPATGGLSPAGLRRVKLAPPMLPPDLLRRPRLDRRLDAAFGLAATLVVAPAGFGKTTLLAAWATSARRPVAWLSLDAADADPHRLLDHLAAALQEAAAARGLPEPAAIPGRDHPPADRAAALADALLGWPRDVAVVLDDLHEADSPGVREALEALLRHPPPRLHLVIGSRESPVPALPSLARLAAAGLAQTVGPDALRFQPSETRRLIGGGSDAEAIALTGRTEGWPAAVRAAALAGDAASGEGPAGDPAQVRAWLLAEAFRGEPEETLRLLERVAVAERIAPGLAAALAGIGRGEAAALLDRLVAERFFVTRLAGDAPWYRIHPLLREALRERAAARGEADAAALHAAASRWHAAEGLIPEAVAHAAAAGDLAVAADLVEEHAGAWLAREQWDEVAGWLGRLPAEMVEARPALLAVRANDRVSRGAIAAALADAARVERLAGGSALRWEAAAVRCRCANVTGEDARGLAWDLANAPEASAFARSAGVAHWSARMQAEGRAAEAREWMLRRLETLDGERGPEASELRMLLAAIALREADPAAALAHAREALALAGSAGHARTAKTCRLAIGAALREMDDLAAAEAELRAALGEHPGRFVAVEWEIAGQLLETLIARGRVAEASALARERSRLVPPENAAWRSAAASLEALAAIARGDLAAAWRAAAALDPDARQGPIRVGLPELAVRAKVRLAAGDAAGAAADLAEARSRAAARRDRWTEARLLPLLAAAREEGSDRAGAREALAAALEIEPGAMARRFLEGGEPVARLLADPGWPEPLAARAAGALARFAEPPSAPEPAPAAAHDPLAALTPREREVALLAADGLANKEIASALGLSPQTVRQHTMAAYRKLGVAGRPGLKALLRGAEGGRWLVDDG